MSKGIFTDKTHRPTQLDILKAIHPREDDWNEFVEFIRRNYSRQEELKYYGKNYGWAARFKRGGKALVSLYPAQGGFTAQIILNTIDVKKALESDIGPRIRDTIGKARPYTEGRWLFIPANTRKDLQDIRTLVVIKCGTDPARATTERKAKSLRKRSDSK